MSRTILDSQTVVRHLEGFEDTVHVGNIIADARRGASVVMFNKSGPQVVGDGNTAAYEVEDGNGDAILAEACVD